MVTGKTPKNPMYICETCDFITNNNKDFNRHVLRPKHAILTEMVTNDNEKPKKNSKKPMTCPEQFFNCGCGKKYKYPSGLSRHKKTCLFVPTLDYTEETSSIIATDSSNNNNNSLDHLTSAIVELITQTKEIFVEQNKQIVELVAKVGTVGNSLTMNNSNNTNNKFSLNFFLNETCKDALNISDFVKLVKYDVPELEMVGKLGYAEGISQIFLNSLKSIESNKRPIWCSDEKREVMHIKENGAWEKDGEDLNKTKKLLSQITKKFHYPLNDWRAKNPSYKDPDHKKSDEYVFMLQQAMGGAKGQDHEHNKIIKRIVKKVMVKREHNEI